MGVASCHLHHVVWALLAAALLISAAVPGARAQGQTEDGHDFSYVLGAVNGPDRWGGIKQSWASCSWGWMQSPIALSHERARPVLSLGNLAYSYHPAKASIVNRGHDIKVSFKDDAGGLEINGAVYKLKQLHWHIPSDHTIDGHRYDMELHLVHETPQKKEAVIGILYSISADQDPFLKMLEPSIRRVAGTRGREVDIGVVDTGGAHATGNVYYRYMGSFTTPPCTEGVVWTIFEKPRPVAKHQLDLLMQAMGNAKNSRPLQDAHNRDISVFRPKP